MHTASLASGRLNKPVCGVHTVSLASGRPNETVCGMHTASFASGRLNELVCGVHTISLASKTTLQEGGGTNALLPTCGFPFFSFPLLLPLPTPLPILLAPVVFVTWRSTAGTDVAFRRRALLSRDVAWAVVVGGGRCAG